MRARANIIFKVAASDKQFGVQNHGSGPVPEMGPVFSCRNNLPFRVKSVSGLDIAVFQLRLTFCDMGKEAMVKRITSKQGGGNVGAAALQLLPVCGFPVSWGEIDGFVGAQPELA